MAINPDDITTLRVDQLPTDAVTATSLFPHQVGTDLKKDTVQNLIDLVATAIGASSGVGYLAISVTDGQQLPDVPENPSFFLCGAGTYLNVGGFPDVVCTEQLNAVMSLADHWELAVGIPITAFAPNLQAVTDTGNTTTNPIEVGGLTVNSNSTDVAVFNYNSIDETGLIQFHNTNNGKDLSIFVPFDVDVSFFIPKQSGTMCIVDPADDYANDTLASAGGIGLGEYYHTAGVVKIRLT